MGLSSDRLEGATRTQERLFGQSTEEPKRPALRRFRKQAEPAETEEPAEQNEDHQVDDIA